MCVANSTVTLVVCGILFAGHTYFFNKAPNSASTFAGHFLSNDHRGVHGNIWKEEREGGDDTNA